MRVLGSVVEPLVTTVISAGHGPLDGWHITSQLVGDNDPRLNAILRVEHTVQEALCGVLVTSTLNQDVQHGSVLVDGTPQPVPTLVDRERHFVQVPLVAVARMAPTKLACQQWAELAAPESDGLVTDLDPALGEQLLDIAVAEGEAVVQPDGVCDDLGREGGSLGTARRVRRWRALGRSYFACPLNLSMPAPTPLSNGNLLLLDNGPFRLDQSVAGGTPFPFSRVIELDIGI